MELEIYLISTFYCFLVLNHDFVMYILQLQTQQLIMSHIEHLIQTNLILVVIFYSKLMRNLAHRRFLIRFYDGC